jgi:acyl-CoA synthetase (AMP-forming)/AMP-acid ligase II
VSTHAVPPSTRGVDSRAPARLDHFLLLGLDTDVALVEGTTSMTYGALRAAVEARAAQLSGDDQPGPLLLEMASDLRSVVTYLAALALHRPVLLVEPGESAAGRRAEVARRYTGRSAAHPDLALLLSTSGSTGSPKLVRLSRDNVLSNAASIADYLDLRPTDRGVTTLPLHYCYGLSVLHSHLVAGAAIVLTDLSVADACFWDLVADTGVTGLAGVPYTYELLEASGFSDRDLPGLRYLTQAGGRDGPGPRPQRRRAGSASRLRPLRDVWPDRGHRADGLPAALAGRDPPGGRRGRRTGRQPAHRRPGRRRGGRARLHRSQRDDGVRRLP